MAPWIGALAMSLAQRKQQDEAEQSARQQAQAQISGQRAAEAGYPTYGVQAAQFNRKMEDETEGQNWLASLIPMLTKGA